MNIARRLLHIYNRLELSEEEEETRAMYSRRPYGAFVFCNQMMTTHTSQCVGAARLERNFK